MAKPEIILLKDLPKEYHRFKVFSGLLVSKRNKKRAGAFYR